MSVSADELVALLEERPYTTQELAELFGLPSGMNAILGALARAGTIQRLRDHRWAYPGYREPLDAVLEHGPVRRTKQERRPANGQALRHPHERPESMTLQHADREPSWWVTAPREHWSDLAAQHAPRMRESKEARLVPVRTLQ